MPFAADLVGLLLREAGAPYRYGAEVDLADEDPKAHGFSFDCSELMQWGCARYGLVMPDGSAAQLAYCIGSGTVIAVADGIGLQGALLFMQTRREHHVAMSLGNGATIEARGVAYGTGSFDAIHRPWTHAARIPGLEYGSPPPPPAPHPVVEVAAPPWPGRYLTQPPVMRGEDVRQWQLQMGRRGWRLGGDGAYGPASAEVCRAFQREKGLRADGVVGPDTWRAAWAAPVT